MDDSFLALLAKPGPTPGGGAAAAHAASVALALLEKIVRIEVRRGAGPEQRRAFWDGLLAEVIESADALAGLRDADCGAYQALADARADGNKGEDVERALAQATECPLKLVRETGAALLHASKTGQRCAKHLLPDLLVVCELLNAAGRGAYHIASANLRAAKDAGARDRSLEALRDAGKRARRSFDLAEKAVALRLNPDTCGH